MSEQRFTIDRADFEEAQRLIREGSTEELAAFASRNVEQRAREAMERAGLTPRTSDDNGA